MRLSKSARPKPPDLSACENLSNPSNLSRLANLSGERISRPIDAKSPLSRVRASSLRTCREVCCRPDRHPSTSSLSLVWPLVLAAVVGAALGFGAGYAVAIRDRPVAVASLAPPRRTPRLPRSAAPPVVREPEGGRDRIPAAAARGCPGSAPARPAPPAAPVAPLFAGRVLVRSTPPGARVFVDGHGGGETPATVRDLARGPHQVRLVRDGYTTVERRIVITAAQPSRHPDRAMVEDSAACAAADRGAARRSNRSRQAPSCFSTAARWGRRR